MSSNNAASSSSSRPRLPKIKKLAGPKKILENFARAASPATLASAVQSGAGTSWSRMAPTASAATVTDIISCVPTDYREDLRPALTALATLSSKQQGVIGSRKKLQTHKAAGSWPSQLAGIKLPAFQTTANFREAGSAECGPLLKAVRDAHDAFRSTTLDAAIALKEGEEQWLATQLGPKLYLPPMILTIKNRYEVLSTSVFDPVVSADGTISAWKASNVLDNEYKATIADINIICLRILELTRSRHVGEQRKLDEKKAAKEAADVEMGDGGTNEESAEDRVMRKVLAQLKRSGLDDKVAFVDHIIGSYYAKIDSAFPSVAEIEGSYERKESAEEQVRPQVQAGPEASESSRRRATSLEVQRRLEEGEREAVIACEEAFAAGTLRYNTSSSYPDELLTLSRPLQTRLLLSYSSAEHVSACRFRSNVFYGPDVYVPKELAIHVSTGLKYLFYINPRPSLVRDAYKDFVRRFRWKCLFAKLGDDSPYDPDYDLHKPSTKAPPRAPDYIEAGLAAGQAYCDSHVATVKPLLKHYKDPKFVVHDQLRQFLEAQGYVVTATDKNLGTAIVTREWLIKGNLKLLDDNLNYLTVSREQVLESTRKLVKSIRKLATEALTPNGDFLSVLHPQLSEFLVSNIPDEDPDDELCGYKLPQFYVIPKIHKKPTGYRPIVPCHSVVQEPAAKVVSKYLKRLLAWFPTIIKGSKDLAQKLSEIQTLHPYRKVYICTGDIVAFYPNLNRDHAVREVLKVWFNYCDRFTEEVAPWERALVAKCLQLAVSSPLFVQFQDSFKQQIRGIPMGQSCSPDIANLFGALFERDILIENPKPQIIFFGRYIDDCLNIVYADSHAEALAICEIIQYPGLTLEWSASEYAAPFLDMSIYVDRRKSRLEWRPYSKPLNHLERIPFASFHPPDVKRGTYLGEMSRLATLSSTPGAYVEALYNLKSLYIARGYPESLVEAWTKANRVKRWKQRVATKESSDEPVLVLKTNFNPIWESFNVHEMFDSIKTVWSEEYNQIPWCDLQGRCAHHNSDTIPMPNQVRRAAETRAKTLYKHTIVGSATISTGTPQARKRGLGEGVQTTLEEWIGEGPAWKRAREMTSAVEALQVDEPETEERPFSNEGLAALQYAASRAASPIPDSQSFEVSCRSLDPSLPRVEALEGPVSRRYKWESSGKGIPVFAYTSEFDLYKTDFPGRRFLVSRKRTYNAFDLIATWRRSQMSQADTDTLSETANVDSWD